MPRSRLWVVKEGWPAAWPAASKRMARMDALCFKAGRAAHIWRGTGIGRNMERKARLPGARKRGCCAWLSKYCR